MEIQYRHQLPLLLDHFNLPKIGAELGVAQGHFSHELLTNGVEVLYCIDSWTELPEGGYDASYPQDWHNENYILALERLKQFGDRVKILKGLTSEVHSEIPDNSLGILYLDAGHNKTSASEDLNNYYSKVVDGGIISGHDYPNLIGVKEAVEEFCKTHNKILHLIPETHPTNSSFWFRK